MSEDETTLETEDSVDTTQEEVDWQKRYIDTQAEYTRQQQAYRDLESKLGSEDALLGLIEEKFPHLLADDETDVVEDDDEPQFMTKAEFAEYQKNQAATQAAEKATAQYEADLRKFVGDRELSAHGRKAIDYSASQGEIKSPEELKQAVTEWFEYEDQLRGPDPKKKRVPHTVTGGQTATGVKDFSEMTRDQVDQWMVDEVRARTA